MSQLYRSPSRASRQIGSFLLLALMMMTLQLTVPAPGAEAAPKVTSINLTPAITSINLVNGQLFASGTVTAVIKGVTHTVPFSGVPVNISLAEDQTGAGACPILDLELQGITLNLLGLVVETSDICLKITAYAGGGLLGDLLCSIANLLNQGVPLNTILAGLSATDITTLTSGLTGLFNGALGRLLEAILTAINIIDQGHTCAILHLELGPLNLTLLGLEVVLDDCEGGPVTVDITAQTGKGNLLGNLLCELLGGDLLNLGDTLQDIIDLLEGLLNQ